MPAKSLNSLRSEYERLRSENEELRLRLDEAEQTLEAIRTGQVESLIVEGPDGPRIFSLEGADYSYRVLVEAMSEGAATFSEDGTILFCNRRFAELLSVPLERLMGSAIRQFLPDHARDGFEAMVREASEGESRGELELRAAGGQALPVFLSMSVIRDADHRRLCLVATDLRSQKRSEEMVGAERLARAVLEQAAEAIVVCDEQGRVIRANRAARELAGHNALLASSDVGFPLVLDSSRPLAPETRVASRSLRGEVLSSAPAWMLRSDGSKAHLLVSAAPLTADGDRIIGCVVTMTDVTELRRSEEALRENEERLRLFIEHVPVALAMFDRQMRYISASRRWHSDFGLDGRDLRGLLHYEVFPEVPERWKEVHRRGLAGEVLRAEEDPVTRLDGTVQWLRWEVRPWRDSNGEVGGLVFFSEDITERKHREVAEAEHRRLYKTVTDNATLTLFIMDSHQQCVFMNPAAERLTGFTFEEVQGRPLHDVIHHTRPNGSLYPQAECPIDRALSTRGQEQGEDVFVHKDGRFYPVAFTASPIVENGVPVGTVIEVRDTAPEKEVERELRHAVAVREEFLTVASHELRTPLTALSLHLELIKELVARVADGGELEALKNVDAAIRQSARLDSLIEALLNVSCIAAGRLELQVSRFDLRSLVEDTVDRLSALSARAGCKVQMHLGDEATGTWDRGRLDEVLTNLLGNAVKYGPGKPIDVTVVADCDWVSLSVKDNGIGVPREAQARIFGRFERAESINYGGLGLGLYIARQLVEAHGGSLEVQSVPGEGATFTARLPRKAQTTEVPSVSGDGDRGAIVSSAYILVVDDDEDIRETVLQVLASKGFGAIGASDGAEALRVMRASSSLPVLIFLDLMMPGMSGPDFLAAQRADPALVAVPVVLVSADANIAAKAASLGVTEFLRKPVTLAVLIATAKRFSEADSQRTRHE